MTMFAILLNIIEMQNIIKFWFNNLVAKNVRIVFYGISDLTEIAYITLQETPSG